MFGDGTGTFARAVAGSSALLAALAVGVVAMLSGFFVLLARRCRTLQHGRSWITSALVAVLITTGGAVALATSASLAIASAASAPGPVLGPACPDVMVIAARGSGEQPQPGGPHGSWNDPAAYTFKDTYYGVGQFNYNVYSTLKTADSRLRFSLDPVRYSADQALEAVTDYPTYEASAAAGAYSIVTEIARTRAACGDQVHFVLVGYSQGAWSVHRALYALAAQNDGSLARISAVVLFGDPEFRPGQVIDRGGQNGLTNSGLATPVDVSSRNVPVSLRSRTASYCLPRDPVCQGISPVTGLAAGAAYLAHCWAVNWAPGRCPHTSYLISGATAQAANFVQPFLPKTSLWPHLTLTTPPSGTVGDPYSWAATATPQGNFTWTSDGTLPPGLSFSAMGVLSGIPAQAGMYSFSVTVTDPYGRSAHGQVSVTIKSGLSTGEWANVSTGGDSTCATRTDGTLWCWGLNSSGALGTGDTTDRHAPVQVGTTTAWVSVSTAGSHTCATRADGTLWCWGYNGGPGTGGTTGEVVLSPVQVGTATNWATVSTGQWDTCATRTDGTLWCWGYNYFGELGTGDTTDESAPVQVGTATNWVEVSTGTDESTCAVRTDGTLWCWGLGDFGQLGTGSGGNELAPVQVDSTTNWAAVSVGFGDACAVRTDGTLWCWGFNDSGQLGTGNTSDESTPVQVGTATNWARISAGEEDTCATRRDGSLWCWGRNGGGQLGTGDTASELVPVQVGTATNWATISFGLISSCGTHADGTLWCWGDNSWGELGTGDTTVRMVPTEIA